MRVPPSLLLLFVIQDYQAKVMIAIWYSHVK